MWSRVPIKFSGVSYFTKVLKLQFIKILELMCGEKGLKISDLKSIKDRLEYMAHQF